MGKYKSRGIRATWNSETMEEALRLLRQGHSQREVEQQTGIPRRTLRNHLKTGATSRKLGRKPILTDEQEADLENRIIRLANIGLPLTPKSLRRSVYNFIETNRIGHQRRTAKNVIGKDWYSAFLKRHPRISKRKAQSMNQARSQKLNKFIVTDYFKTLNVTLEKFDLKYAPNKIFNMDEKGCRLTLHHQQSVLALKGSKRVHLVSQEHGENVTIVACVNALGNAIPPMILFKGVRQKPTFSDNLPTGSTVAMSPKGSMTCELFCKWLDHFAKYKPAGKVLLIFDGAACHLDITIVEKAGENNIELLCLPSNTTHELQPLDKAVFRSFEHFWDDELLKYWDQNPDRRLTKDRFATVFTPVWEKCMTVANITSGFRCTGIYPYNPCAIPEEAFAPSTITRKEFEETDFSSEDDIPLSTLRLKIIESTRIAESIPGPSGTQRKKPTSRSPLQEKNKQDENLGSRVDKKSFKEILKTPDFPQRKTPIRKKAFNYRSQHVTKDLFNQAASPSSSSKQKKSEKKFAEQSKKNVDGSWYCFLCKSNVQLAMRSCIGCHSWVHEECTGLLSDDEEDFTCPRCDN